jgi:hypothetical protein
VLHHPVTSDLTASLEECEAISDAVMALKVPTILIYPNVDAGSKDMVGGATCVNTVLGSAPRRLLLYPVCILTDRLMPSRSAPIEAAV